MSEPAKRIYVYQEFTHKVTERHETDIEYVRADIVEEMREALEESIRFTNIGHITLEKARAALKRLEEE